MCVAPLEVSKVSKENDNAQGTLEFSVRVISPRISPREPDRPALANGRLEEAICPEVTVNELAEPMVAPLELRNEMLPVQDAAVPLEESDAALTTLMRAVSVLPRPAGGSVRVRVPVVVVCASSDNIEPAVTSEIEINLRRDMLNLSRELGWPRMLLASSLDTTGRPSSQLPRDAVS